ncbi:MAG TPA: CusA/CzcA family heavy metal efflux RND transporter [Bacteroidales bacterium]|nr:CusA/CzcA family heavy metal efflux RND transporter [Bacteroidales bacterium]
MIFVISDYHKADTMLNKTIDFSIRNKLVIGMLTLALIIWGIYNFIQLPVDAVPDITNNQVQVITVSPSLAPQEVEQFITFPVETTMANIQDVTEIRSISRFGLSVVTIVFKDKVDILKARQRVSEQIKVAESRIPENYGTPEMMPVTTGLGEIYQYVLQPRPGFEQIYSLYDLRTIQDWIVKRHLSGIPGIVDISSFGGLLKQYEVAINPQKLVGMNLTITEIFEALEKNNQNSGGSYIEKKQNAYYIRTQGIVNSREDIEKIVVKQINGIPLMVGDIATVKIGAPPRFGAMTKDGKGEAVGGITLMLKGDNSSKVIGRVKERMARIQTLLPPGLEIKPYLDRSVLIKKTIQTVTKNLVEGGLIVIFVLVLLLGNFRSGLVVASVIPLSMLFAISLMNVFGVSANLMSLGAIDFGLIVDGSVIVVEGMIHHLQRHFNHRTLTQQEMDDTVFHSASRVGRSAIFGVFIILIVYIPIFAFSGTEGKMFKPMAQTVSFALLGALLLSFTYVPMIASVFLKKKVIVKGNISDRIMDFMHRQHDKALNVALKIPVAVIGSTLVIVVVSLWIFTRMGGEFLPTLEEGDLACQMTLTPGTSLSQSIATTTRVEEILTGNFPEVTHVVSKIGSAEIPTDPMAIEDADIMITMKPKSAWKSAKNREEMVEKMKAALDVLPGVSFDFSQPIQLRFNELMTGVKADVAIKIFGEDLDQLFTLANQGANLIRKIQGAGDVRVEQIVGLPQLVVTYNRDRIAQYGLNINEVNRIVKTAFAGESTGLVFEGEKRFDLVVRLDEEFRRNPDALTNLRINRPNEDLILLSQVADIRMINGPMQISREQTQRRVTIGINVRNRDVESFIGEADRILKKELILPSGYYITYGGQFENLKSAKQTSAIAVPVALAAIFVMLFFAFGSFRQSVMIFTAIPLAAVGGIWMLLIRGMPFSISAGVGFIALFGIAVLNGIVLISHYNQLEKEGVTDILERIRQGTSDRLRPVIMTSLVAAMGFVPMALSTAAGAEVQKPLASVVIGGILTSSFLTLVVLPVLYLIFNAGVKGFISRLKRTKALPAAPAILLMIVALPLAVEAQVTPRELTMEQAVESALKNNPRVKNFNLEVQAQKKLIQSAVDIQSPVILVEDGEINSDLRDYKITISQEIAFPMVYVEQAAVQKRKTRLTGDLAALKTREFIAEVRLKFSGWNNLAAQLRILKKQDSVFADFISASKKQYESGSINRLTWLMAESRALRVKNQLKSLQSDFLIAEAELKHLLCLEDPLVPPATRPERLTTVMKPGLNSENSIYLHYLDLQVDYQKANLRKESWSAAPAFNIGWFTQSIDQMGDYTGFQYGLSIPVWFWVPAGKIQSAKINREIALNEREIGKRQLALELDRLSKSLDQHRSNLDYYEQAALNQSEGMIESAEKSYHAGEIDYFDYVISLGEAFSIQYDYITELGAYNQTVIEINRLIGE